MKSEARILVGDCRGNHCIGIIVRGNGIDGAVSARSCASLCGALLDKGYWGELRYAVGNCRCGLPAPPQGRRALAWERLVEKILGNIEELILDP